MTKAKCAFTHLGKLILGAKQLTFFLRKLKA